MKKQEQHEKNRKSHESLLAFSKFPMSQLWRFVVDGNKQMVEKGWEAYDNREPGSVSAVIRAMALALQHVDKPIDIALIKALHKACGENVKLFSSSLKLGEFGNAGVRLSLMPETCSLKGIKDFINNAPRHGVQGHIRLGVTQLDLQQKIQGDPAYAVRVAPTPLNYFTKEHEEFSSIFSLIAEHYVEGFEGKKIRLLYYPPGAYPETEKKYFRQANSDGYTQKPLENHVQDILDTYSREQEAEVSFATHARNIAVTAKEFAHLHPFKDLDNRTFINGLFFLMQIKIGASPTLFADPNIFDMLDIDAIMLAIESGQQNTQMLIENPQASVFGVAVSKDSPIPQKLKDATVCFIEVLSAKLYQSAGGYLKEEPAFALTLYEASLSLYKQAGAKSLINLVARLYGVGLARSALQQDCSDIIAALVECKAQCAKPAQTDLSGFTSTINKYIGRLQTPQNTGVSVIHMGL